MSVQFDRALKVIYAHMQEQLALNTVAWGWMSKGKNLNWSGKYVQIPIHTGLTDAVGAFDGLNLHAPGTESIDSVLLGTKYVDGAWQVEERDALAVSSAGIDAPNFALKNMRIAVAQKMDSYAISGGRFPGVVPQHTNTTGGGASTTDFAFDGDFAKLTDILSKAGGTCKIKLIDLNLDGAGPYGYVGGATAEYTLSVVGAVPYAQGWAFGLEISDTNPALAYLDLEPHGFFFSLCSPAFLAINSSTVSGAGTGRAASLAAGKPGYGAVCTTERDTSVAGEDATNTRVLQSASRIENMLGIIADREAPDTPKTYFVSPRFAAGYLASAQGTFFTSVDKGPANPDSGPRDRNALGYGGVKFSQTPRLSRGILLCMARGSYLSATQKKLAPISGVPPVQQFAGTAAYGGWATAAYNHASTAPWENGVVCGMSLI